jgi:transcriptional regulator with XRE-family HTH domain
MSTTLYGQRLVLLRRHLGLTLQELADKTGISKSYLGDISTGRSKPSRRVVSQLAESLNVSSDWLLYGTGPMFQAKVNEQVGAYLPESKRDLDQFKKWLEEFWVEASEQERAWLSVQLKIAFPQYRQWLHEKER